MEDSSNFQAWNPESSPATQSPAHLFQNATGFGIERSQFMNILGNMNVHPITAPLPAIQAPAEIVQTNTGLGIPPLHSLDPPDDVYSDSGSYCSQLLRQGRGFPLYVPGPQRNLPQEYRRKGVSIGDVGRVTPEGIFDFFFNIYLPAEHPINANDVPENFYPLTQYFPRDVVHLDFDSGNYVATPSLRKLDLEPPLSDFPGGDFIFDCNAPRGAVLALPHGSQLTKLENLEHMRRYASEHAESWYKYINGARGRGLANGSLYLVTGCEKSRSWGMAAFQDVTTEPTFQLSFKPYVNAQAGANGYRYRWMVAGPARTKDSGLVPVNTGGPLDQTNFIHGLSISLGTGIWGRLFKHIEIRQIVDSQLGRSNNAFVPYGSQGFSFSWVFGFLAGGGGGNTGNQRALAGREQGLDDVTISEFPPVPKLFHPSQVIHEHLLAKFPEATVVISHDDDWCDIFRDDGSYDAQNALNLLQRVCEQFTVIYEDGRATVSRLCGNEMQPPAFGPMSFPPAGFSSPERPTLPGIHTSDSFRPTQSDYQSRSSSQPGPQPKGKRQRNPQSLGDPKDDGMEINVDEEPAKPPGICGRCKALKMKCEFKTETDPCKRCLNGGHDCITLGRKKRRTPPKREHLLNQIREQAAEIQRLMSQLAEAQLAEANIRHDQPSNSSDYGTGSSTKIGSDADIEEWISKARYIAEVSNTIGIGGPDMPKSSLVKEKNSSSSSEDSVSDDSKGALECKVEIKSEDEEVTLRERGNPPRPHSVASSNSTDRGTRAPKLEGSGNLKLEMLPFEGSPFGLMANLSLNSDEAKTPKGRGHTPTLKMENDDFLKPNPSRLLDEPILPHILTTGLVTPEEAEMLFDIYFQRMNISVSLLDPVLYTAQKTCLRSPFLFTVVCAIASRFYTDRPELYLQAMHFAQLAAGTALISGHKSVEYCQGYILMSLYPIPARRWEEDRVWLYLGLAIRIATDLNLHLPNTTKPTDENDAREMLNRTRVWLNCFNLDRSTGSQYGKAPIISNDDYMANHSEDWWRSSPYNMACDIQICAYTAEFKVMATFMAKVYSDPSHPTGLNKFVDFEGLAGETDEELKRLADKWRLVLEQADKRDVENRFRSGLLNLNCSYARLVALSFGIQHSFGKNNTDENPFLMRCLTVVMEAVTAIVQDVGGPDQKVYLRHGPIAQSVFSAFAASMLVKLLQPKFASYITTDKRQEIYGLVENVINLLASTDVSIDDKHGPNLYARFLKSLLAAPLAKVDDSRQRRRRRSNSGDSTASSHTSLDTLHSLSPAPTAAALSFDRFAPPLGGSIDPFMPLALPSGSALGIDADPSAPDFYPPLPYNQDPPLESLGTGWPDDFSWMNQLPRAEYTRPHEGMNSNSY